jgi:protein-S-isoprenylcysteine O-methyltransferase Ste14
MLNDSIFRFIFIAVVISNIAIAVYHRLQAGKSGEKISRKEEGQAILAARVIGGIAMWVTVLLYMISPRSMSWSTFSIPQALRWIGAGLSVAGVPLLYWVMHSLGKNLTDTVVTRANHTLVTTGPYRWVRHPFYTVVFGSVFALGLVAANWLIGLLTLLMFVIIVIRTDKEEEMLIKRFGDDYRHYMKRTGRFLPRLISIR